MEHNTYEASCSWDMRDKCTEDIGPLVSRETQTQNMNCHSFCIGTRLLKRVQKDPGVYESSMKWLESSSLENCGLTLSHLLSLCTTTHMPDGGYQMHISTESLADFEEQLYMAIEMYHDQIKCLTQGSKKVFGVVNGSRLGILVDTSDLNCSEERLPDLQQHLLMLIEEQLHLKKQLHLLSYSTEISSLWNKPVETCPPRLRESRAWVLQLQAGGGCDLLQAVQKVLIHSQLDTLLIILATRPDQTVDMICDYIAQSRMPSVHAVAYNCSSPDAIETVKRMAAVTGGKYHLFSAALGVIDSSTDVEMLWTEIKTARDILTHIHSMRQGRFQGIPVTVQSEIFMSLNSLTLSESSPVPCSVSALLYIQLTDPKAISSREWLNINGLKAQKLDLYQLLASNAYSPQRTFVPILGKTVSSTVHERVMVQFEWWDGTVKNLHVDLPSLQKYQTKLSTAVRLFEKRVYYLNRTGSLQIWGTVCEQRVQVLLDMSGLSVHYQLHIQHALRLLLQEQLANKHSFNVTVFGSDVKSWQEKMVPTTHENLQAVWQWIQGMECAGGRNTQTALRHVLREEPYGEFTMTQGVYLLTTGMPDQDMVAITAYVSEHCRTANFNLHVCLFTGEEKTLCCPPSSYSTQTDTARALRDLAHAGNGRFLWLTETGIVESDDIQVLIEEMEMAANYCQKCSELVDCLMQKSSRRGSGKSRFQETSTLSIKPKISTRSAKLSPPRPTKLSVARLENRQKIRSAQNRLTWRPSSSKADIPAVHLADSSMPSTPSSSAHQRRSKVSQSVFYMEDGNLGVVFKKYPKPKSVRRSIAAIKLPKHEELCSTKQWLKRFGFKNLKLDLEKMLSRPECSHPDNLVPSVQKRVSAKYCAIFPSVQINGIVKHLHLTPAELKQYLSETEKLMQRYTQRMKWLLTGSRCMFGAVLEKTVCVLLDVSGSMASFLPELQKGLALLIWDQLHANSVRFNMLVFSGEVRLWQSGLVQSTTDLCKDAVQWLNQLSTHGGSCTLQALQTGCGFEDPVALYLISDGRSDSSHSLILREIDTMRQEKSLTIHTIAVNSHDRACCEFLKCLAHRTAGRFHQAPDNTDADILKHLSALHSKDSVLPKCEGDDLRRLAVEIEKLTFFQKQAKTFRETIVACRNLEDS
ncbi:von Willebrand factor A domain-containing protein 3A isoform X2 [Triplophysa dalaica]|uniref:von Willebrand factor A domain-containing protein 3A isoform X2 n=1 Tax=Triplophysa dalaica TaxID=1582913 RepID=UPI0024DF5B5E|nr:von Willebrand factor A domain-containing protein 3A isoform X2 [Triplophysa dalaica]XP_056607676.1 von Willebrand factor A domain-containing protein 3A isoform X2 [Triplophysa dalaica]XP_056607677.1 von Willebrand factor A domain-containing protein 3A isoform X2 [Triplophysa dalaica]XP_056607678.1 von Willebrand factor A domain-containing protein 3A isoform X2 [Triplophysa dalaica]